MQEEDGMRERLRREIRDVLNDKQCQAVCVLVQGLSRSHLCVCMLVKDACVSARDKCVN